ncbi:unnamed protein product [Meganyctiphanes norvegica]|uniref:Pescadillo homolog n=1 Tax=Meganyctiphanes norvegica TaxID=48144 RepID=A0AAV2R0Y0_MEGNR
MGLMKKKGDSGKAAQYYTRSQAIRRLQLSLHDFRRLCILKGVYPRIPKSRKKAQKGDSRIRTLYYKKDIKFLIHEPIIWKFREHKIYLNKIKKYKGKKDLENARRVEDNNRPTYDLAHIVRERYPTFIDALGDLDDALSLNFLYAALPRQHRTHSDMHTLCRRLCVEWMHYIMESRSLRKVFVSIKGYYYQAEILGQTITWIVPHPFAPHGASDVDFRIMNTFCEFYIALLGFVNCRVYHKLNLYYPPTLVTETERRRQEGLTDVSEVVASLNAKLKRRFKENNNEEDESAEMDTHLLEDQNAVGEAIEEQKRKAAQKKLFEGSKFFLGREINRESLAFTIRSFGGEVSWDASASEGSTYPETDEKITHQIVDRGTKSGFEKKYLSRYYLQPQWVYDCVNSGILLPMQRYFPGVSLPPHLSPFVTQEHPEGGGYIPPEQRYIQMLQEGKEIPNDQEKEEESEEEPMNESDEDEDDENEDERVLEKDEEDSDEVEEEEDESENEDEIEVENMLEKLEDNESDDEINEEENGTKKDEKEIPDHARNMAVRRGKRMGEHEFGTTHKFDKEAERFKIMMIPKKRKNIYNRLKREETKDSMKKKTLERKREKFDKQEKIQKKLDKAAALKKEEKNKIKDEILKQKKKEKKQKVRQRKAQTKAVENSG